MFGIYKIIGILVKTMSWMMHAHAASFLKSGFYLNGQNLGIVLRYYSLGSILKTQPYGIT